MKKTTHSADFFRQHSLNALRVLNLRDERIKVIESGSPIGSEAYGMLRGERAISRITYTGTLGGSYTMRSIQSGDVLATVVRSDDAAKIAGLLAGGSEMTKPDGCSQRGELKPKQL